MQNFYTWAGEQKESSNLQAERNVILFSRVYTCYQNVSIQK